MKELIIGEKTIRVRATPLALLFYKQEFKNDLLGDLLKMEKIKDDLSQFDTLSILQMVWAMNKADGYKPGQEFPSFESWLGEMDGLDISDPEFMTGALEEAANGFFRKGFQSSGRKQ